mmetsp:Transcript_8009/g.17230  ORF Transcript_8009/g.17230 Transcript_8009/m.17230 type:complete len:81 (-) Transcript_8009:136-378(-)
MKPASTLPIAVVGEGASVGSADQALRQQQVETATDLVAQVLEELRTGQGVGLEISVKGRINTKLLINGHEGDKEIMYTLL